MASWLSGKVEDYIKDNRASTGSVGLHALVFSTVLNLAFESMDWFRDDNQFDHGLHQ